MLKKSRDDFIIAIRSAFLKKGTQQRFSLLTLIIFSIFFLTIGNFNLKFVNFNKTIIKEIIYITSFVASIPENIFKNSFNKVTDHFEIYDDYQINKNELQKLRSKELSRKIITYENTELKRLIDDYFIEDSLTYAKVLSDKKSPFLKSIIINKGSKNNMKLGMVVYDNIYLIGKVVEVNFLTSRVLLISDINSKVPVTIQPINIQAIMSGVGEQKGMLQYIKGEKLPNNINEELIVVTSGSGGMYKSGIPIGKINSANISNDREILVDFYRNFSQLKYVKVSSYSKENINFDKSNKKTFDTNKDQILKMNNQAEDIKMLQQQKIINTEIRIKFENENTKLRSSMLNIQKKLSTQNKLLNLDQIKSEHIKFLEFNLLHGHKCRKSFLKPKLYKVNSIEYKTCVFKKARYKKN